ncbi:hypothetical protein TIFTF001_034310 [Ficus carica]|uniref:Uncharacterized protein n=1 Tax=Ficus carica TaxID=3494 RepID=A0AA88DZM3_FICCA|nr:hypothetical protein TIFTF001_034310 [Ficus carica]
MDGSLAWDRGCNMMAQDWRSQVGVWWRWCDFIQPHRDGGAMM